MRTIKFRGWDGSRMVHPEQLVVCAEKWFENGSRFEDWIPSPNQWLMQFTGLLDKNGKEIYEGDIVEVVRLGDFFGDDEPQTEILIVSPPKYAELEDQYLGGPDGKDSVVSIWVLGNIYENPELLEKLNLKLEQKQ